MSEFDLLLAKVRACTICASQLSAGVRPVLQIHPHARLLVAGQAPGRKVHQSGVPFDDASGERLREWMGVSGETFYDAQQIAILPMGFCFRVPENRAILHRARSARLPGERNSCSIFQTCN